MITKIGVMLAVSCRKEGKLGLVAKEKGDPLDMSVGCHPKTTLGPLGGGWCLGCLGSQKEITRVNQTSRKMNLATQNSDE